VCFASGAMGYPCHAWQTAAIAQGIAVVMLAAAALVYNERRADTT